MKKCLPYLLLAAVLFPVATFAEEAEMDIEAAERQLEMTNIQLEQKRAESEFDFEQQMRELELGKMRLEIEHAQRQFRGHGRHKPEGAMCIVLLIALLTRILSPIWIYRDMRQRGAVSVLLVLFGILGGLFGLLVYAVVRLGDIKPATRTTRK